MEQVGYWIQVGGNDHLHTDTLSHRRDVYLMVYIQDVYRQVFDARQQVCDIAANVKPRNRASSSNGLKQSLLSWRY